MCNLISTKVGTSDLIAFHFKDKEILFQEIASSSTKDLLLFFYWLERFKEVSFAYIDEFDAHYHHSLSRLVMTKIINIDSVQTVVTTHSTSLLNNRILRPDCYFKLENSIIKSLDNLTTRELERAHDIEKIYRNGGFDE